MQSFIERNIRKSVEINRRVFPVTAILGPRQCGKSTFVKMLASQIPSLVYIDLQNVADVNKLTDPRLFFKANEQSVICLDEIQQLPYLFNDLRSIIDEYRTNGRFIILGSASPNLIQKSAETLAGRIGFVELTPFLLSELTNTQTAFILSKYWFRGAFPDSYLALGDEESMLWRENFIRTYIERDLPQLGIQLPALQLRRLLTMFSHMQGQLFNSNKLAESMGVTHPTIRRYLDLFEQTYIVRTLQPYLPNIKKRLIKSPKVYVRDSGILHQLLQINSFDQLMGNPIFGSSWEGIVIENIASEMNEWQPFYYRTAMGDEIDLVLVKGDKKIAIECKTSSAPNLTKGFWKAVDDVAPEHTFVVVPINESYPIKENVTVAGISQAIESLKSIK